MWAELIDNSLLGNPDATVNVHNVLNVAQRMMALLGNANKMLSQFRRCKILAAVDPSLVQYGKKSQPDRGKFLFGSGFTKYLKREVETDSSLAEVVSLSKRYHPYNSNSHQSTIGRTKTQFFRGGPTRRGPLQGSYQSPPSYQSPQSSYQPHQQRGSSSYKSRGRGRPFSVPQRRF